MADFSELMQMGQQMQERLAKLQAELGDKSITGSAGGGMVTATADGKGHIKTIKIDPTVVGEGDVEMLEDLVTAAVSEAQKKAEALYQDEMKKMAGGLPLPFKLPL